MIILGIDPGSEKSAILLYESHQKVIINADIFTNAECLVFMRKWFHEARPEFMAIEMVASYGMPVGKSVFETVFWIGRFWEAVGDDIGKSFIYRSQVKMHLCNSMRAKDSNIRQALIDKFGGSREAAIGTKKKKGPLYGISKDLWSALAVAVTYAETRR